MFSGYGEMSRNSKVVVSTIDKVDIFWKLLPETSTIDFQTTLITSDGP